jgi:hypothetical protein
MYITDLEHFLEDKGAIGPTRGRAKSMADFLSALVAHATDFDKGTMAAPTCFKCRKLPVEALVSTEDTVDWICPSCLTEGRISNWQDTLWDLSDRPDVAAG